MWDNLTCWQPARIGEVVEVNCPEIFSDFMSEEDYSQSPMTTTRLKQFTAYLQLMCYSSDFV